MEFLKIGSLTLNLRHIESVGMDVEFQGKRVTFIRMNRTHTQRKTTTEGVQEKEISISYRFEGRAALAVNAFFSGEMPIYPGYNGWLFDIALGMKHFEKVKAKQEFEVLENKVEALDMRGGGERTTVTLRAAGHPGQETFAEPKDKKPVKLDLSKVRMKLEKPREE